MIQFTATIQKFEEKGEKTGWTYIEVPATIAQQLKPDTKKAFRVKGLLDAYAIEGVSLAPMGGGNFILPLNATMRKGIRKQKGASLQVQLTVDEKEIRPPAALMECLADEPGALAHFNQLPKSHQNYFTRWINEAKTEGTKAKRIAQAVTALAKGLDFSQTLRSIKEAKKSLY
jgi:hypothetical protein